MAWLPLPEGNNASETIRKLRAIDAEFFGSIYATSGTIDSITATNINVESGTLGDLTVDGWITTGTGGGIRTATSGQRIQIEELEKDRIRFYTGESWEEKPGSLLSAIVGTGSSQTLNTSLFAPTTTGDSGAVYFVLQTESQDDSTAPPKAILAYAGGSTQTPIFQLQNDFRLSVLDAGTAAAPAISVGAASNYGLYEYATGFLGVTVNGAFAGRIASSGDWYFGDGTTGRAQIIDASTAALPTYSFQGDNNTGMRRSGSDQLAFSAGGIDRLVIDANGLTGDAVEWKAWTPTVTNVTKGNGNETARYTRIGDTVIARYKFELQSTSAVTGDVTVTVPVAMAGTMIDTAVGYGLAHQSGVSNTPCTMQYVNSTTVRFRLHNSSGTYLTFSAFSGSVPFSWGTNDALSFTIIYEAA